MTCYRVRIRLSFRLRSIWLVIEKKSQQSISQNRSLNRLYDRIGSESGQL